VPACVTDLQNRGDILVTTDSLGAYRPEPAAARCRGRDDSACIVGKQEVIQTGTKRINIVPLYIEACLKTTACRVRRWRWGEGPPGSCRRSRRLRTALVHSTARSRFHPHVTLSYSRWLSTPGSKGRGVQHGAAGADKHPLENRLPKLAGETRGPETGLWEVDCSAHSFGIRSNAFHAER
jgi:hypothetical protein